MTSILSAQAVPKKSERQFREELEALNKEGNALNEQRIRIQTEIERAKKEKEQLEADLLAEFGTSDLTKLAAILSEREQANERALKEYRDSIKNLSEAIGAVSSKQALIK